MQVSSVPRRPSLDAKPGCMRAKPDDQKNHIQCISHIFLQKNRHALGVSWVAQNIQLTALPNLIEQVIFMPDHFANLCPGCCQPVFGFGDEQGFF
jgi:hypothetical protein